jgi:beta-1,4-mannosyl-glycoprotein beta-1,4-N-acetylglucosaminyltransferase
MISISLIVYHHSISRDHYLSPDLILLSTYMADAHVRPRTEDIQTICHAHDFAARDDSEYPRKVYDLVLLSTELDWLEIRLHTVADYVDYFVIVESPTTFTGKPKPLYSQLRNRCPETNYKQSDFARGGHNFDVG